MGHADVVRKAMGKKKVEIMEQQKSIFVYGGINENTAVKISCILIGGVLSVLSVFCAVLAISIRDEK